MDETSTQLHIQHQATAARPTPKARTIGLIKQFARAYMPISSMPGLVLN